MRLAERSESLLPERREGAGEVNPVELFFDLVYVLAITQLTHYLVAHLTLRGALETLVLLLAVWAAWIHIVWTTNYFDLGPRSVRLALIGVMLVSLVMSASLPEAFEERGLVFAAALVVILVGWSLLVLVVVGHRHPLSAVFVRVLVWMVVSGALLLAGGLAAGDTRLALWLVAVGLLFTVVWLRFPVPLLGRSRTTDYTITGEHMAHRCYLFIILALGESILIVGADFGRLPLSAGTVAAFLVAFTSTVTFWWIYFDRAEEAGAQVIAQARDPGGLALSAYTYYHIPMVTGIVAAAAAVDLTIAHPTESATVATTLLILGGPILFLVGHSLFKWALWHHVPRSRLVAGGALAALALLAVVSSLLVLLTAATFVLVVLASWTVRADRRRSAEP